MSYYIEKQFEGHVAHRIDSQKLCSALTGGMTRTAPCRAIHGHSASFFIGLESDRLVNEMVIDFNMLKWVDAALKEHYDHRFTLAISDPLYKFLVEEAYNQLGAYAVENGFAKQFIPLTLNKIDGLDGGEGYQTYTVNIPDEYRASDCYLIELLDSFTITEFKTSSENLAHWMYNVVNKHFNKIYEETTDQYLKDILSGIRVAKVSYKESAKSLAVYSE